VVTGAVAIHAAVGIMNQNPTLRRNAMHSPQELEARMWKALKSDRTLMLGLDGVEDGHARPMTAQVEGERGPIWFFGARDSALVKKLANGHRAIAAFSSKDHELFASIKGELRLDFDRAAIDRLWNPFVAAWYEGKDDPKLALLRLDPEHAEIWLNANSLLAGVKMLLGVDPKQDYKDNVANVDLG
jgi:general stress protein 26